MPTERAAAFRIGAALAVGAALWLVARPAPAAQSSDWARDPVHVWYDGADCPDDEIEIEVWDREKRVWKPHPAHPRVAASSCQVEEAGWLLNELRWRCRAPGSNAPWRGFRTFDPDVMARCAVGGVASSAGDVSIVVTSAKDGVPVKAPEPRVTLVGNVRVGGLDGSDYDVALVIDRSMSAEAIDAQRAAARSFVARVASRLGAVRVAVLSVDGRGAWRELGWSADARRIDAALARVGRAHQHGPARPEIALGGALAELDRGRNGARPVVLLGLDGERLGADEPLAPIDPLRQMLSRARTVALHWRALGGAASEAPTWLRGVVAAGGSFERIPPQRLDAPLWSGVALPVAESVRVTREGGETIDASVDAQGVFRAELPVVAGSNPLRIRARSSDGRSAEQRFDLVFDDAQVLEGFLEAERARIRAAQRKRLELEAEEPGKR